jgi:NAD(P)-dependent dehydrogenase (short-subunit alcohol dehydrogenase family)
MAGAARTVVVTGGGAGLGAAISRAFHAAGDRVVIASRTDRGLAAELGGSARFIACDVRDPRALAAMIEEGYAWARRLDALINNAGRSAWRPAADVDEAFWDDMLAVNLKGAFFACRAAAARLGSGGCIVNVSSLAGKRGSANNAVYCAAKFGLNGVTQALAKELGPRQIRVNAVCPVYIQTDGLVEALGAAVSPTAGGEIDAYLAGFATQQSALGRLPTAEQVAATCLFLASDAAAAITGQCLNVDCGVLPQ